MSNYSLDVFADDWARERGVLRERILGELRARIEASRRGRRAITFDEKRGAFETGGELEEDVWMHEIVREAIVERVATPFERAEVGPMRFDAEDELAVARGDWALVVVGRRLARTLAVEEVRKLSEKLARQTEPSWQAIPTKTLGHTFGVAKPMEVVVGRVLAACESHYVPCGPYRGAEILERARRAKADFSRHWDELGEFPTQGETGVFLVSVGKYASAYLVSGMVEACPLDALDPGWPALYRDRRVHADLRFGHQLPHFLVRGELVRATGREEPVTTLSESLPDDLYLQLRTFEDDEAIGQPRKVDETIAYEGVNSLAPPKAPSPPHRAKRTVAGLESPNLGFLSRLFSPATQRAHMLERLERAESFVREFFPDTHEEMGLLPGALLERRQALARLFGIRELPKDADTLLGWHDGQTGHTSFVNDRLDFAGWKLMSCADIEDTHARSPEFADWRPSFLPLFHDGAGDYLVIDVARSNRLCWWVHDSDESVRDAPSDLEYFVEQAEAWPALFENYEWSTLRFDFENAKLREIAEAALAFSRFTELGLGALILAEFADRLSATLLVSRDRDGVTFVYATATDRQALWEAFRKALRKPLTPPIEMTAYQESLLAQTIKNVIWRGHSNDARRLWFGYVAVATERTT
jgi:cell wall assembly regulator SMI1